MVDIQTATTENRRGKKKKKEEDRKKKKPQDRNIMACPIPQGGHKNEVHSRSASGIYFSYETEVIARTFRYQDVSFPARNCQLAGCIYSSICNDGDCSAISAAKKTKIFPQKIKIREPVCKLCRSLEGSRRPD